MLFFMKNKITVLAFLIFSISILVQAENVFYAGFDRGFQAFSRSNKAKY